MSFRPGAMPASYQNSTGPKDPNAALSASVQMQDAIRNLQDEQLADIERGVMGLKEMGLAIGAEADAQNKVVNEIDMDVVKASDGFAGEVEKVEQLIKMESSCKQWVLIVALSVLLIVLILMAPQSPFPWSAIWQLPPDHHGLRRQ